MSDNEIVDDELVGGEEMADYDLPTKAVILLLLGVLAAIVVKAVLL